MGCCSDKKDNGTKCACAACQRPEVAAAALGTGVFAWYAMPDVIHSRFLRGAVKSAALGGVAWCAMKRCDISLGDLLAGNWGNDEDDEAVTDRPMTAAGATEFGARPIVEEGSEGDDGSDAAIGVQPGTREVLGQLRDRETFEAGGTCGCGGKGHGAGHGHGGGGCGCGSHGGGKGHGHGHGHGGCGCGGHGGGKGHGHGHGGCGCGKKQEAAGHKHSCGRPGGADKCGCPGAAKVHESLVGLLTGDFRKGALAAGVIGGALTVNALTESMFYRGAEFAGRRGKRAPHTKQGLVLGSIAAGMQYWQMRRGR
ncbi:MAG: hypothetical protein E7A62_07020 [Actinomycetaceae bacterium]|nr:hypothetical protein [Actinomycetaceae bacterium]MDU0970729.1 hypothetical protein [Actinomycetaceae bacterium]